MIIPSHIQIETINGKCTAKCIMCPINLSEIKRKPNILCIEDFTTILNKFKPYQENIKYISLTGHGETLLDKDIIDKIKIAKNMGFKGIGFPTNCTQLDEQMSISLIRAGLDTLICSIDGITKETHESIRIGTNFEKIISNVKRFIYIRNKLKDEDNIKTKVIIRFIYQNSNRHEWKEFYNYWLSFLNKDIGDDVIKFNIHNCGGALKNYENVNDNINKKSYNKYLCKDIFERFIILSNGNIIFCCGDNGLSFDIGNIFYDDPIKMYNNDIYRHYRKLMNEGRIQELELCKDCTIYQSRIQSI